MPRSDTPLTTRAAVVVAICLGIGLSGCGRKGSLEVPGPTVASPAMNASMTDTAVRENDLAPRLGRRRALDRQLAEQPIGPNAADAPEVGDAIPEGPGTGAAVPRRRFLLDFLL